MIFDLWNWGGSTGKVRVFASQSFYEATTGQFIPQGRVGDVASACQVLNATVSGQDFTIPEITLATTSDSTVPNVTFTVVLYDSSDVARFTLLSQGFIDPAYMQDPPQPSVVVTLAGATAFNGTYDYVGQLNDKPYYSYSPGDIYFIKYVDAFWRIYNDEDVVVYASEFETNADFPWEVETWETVGPGIAPAPTVSEDEFLFTATWEQVTLSNQAAATVGAPYQWNGPFWDVTQTKLYVASVVGGSGTAIPYASNVTAGKTKLDTAPALSTSPIAVGTNSSIITGFTADIASLNTLKAPKANPTFTGTVAVTGNITATTTIAATGNVTGANLSGTNTGNVTVAGENYISLAGQVLTANAVNLSATNVTGTLAAARFPALTGDVTNSAGTVATTIANLAVGTAKIANSAVTDAKVATGIDAVKIADGSITNTEFQYLNGVTSGLQAQIDAKAGLVSPSFTTPSLGTPTAGVLTNCTITTPSAGDNDTSIASTAFVQQLGNGCLVFRATLTQTGTNAPVATIIANTLGGTIVWARTSAGAYTGTLASVFSANKTQVFTGNSPNGSNFVSIIAWRSSSSVITILTQDVDIVGGTSVASDGMLAETAITIIVGP